MNVPNLKRIRIKSEIALKTYLAKNHDQLDPLMLVIHNKSSHATHIDRKQLSAALQNAGWNEGRKYTLNDDLIGHVISKETN